tara:strand:+ start:1845 stop:4607 length:2763 start_codon:yes stop_codon:yes gene_type:complete
MSVQLILQPQNVQGFSNDISVINGEMIVNGSSFSGVNNATGYTTAATSPFQDVLDNAPATVPNTWYKFKSDASANYPSDSFNTLFFSQVADIDIFTGIYQQMTNLIVGQVYDVTIQINGSLSANSYFGLSVSNVNGALNTFIFPNNLIATVSFTATITNPTILFWSASDTVETNLIQLISVIGATQLVNIVNGDGQVICDLYEEEDLPLTLSVDDFKNVAEKVQSYSKAFNLPATKRNNKIFDQVFEITRAEDGIIFNAYRRTQCILKQDGFILFEGYLRLLDVTDKNGEISYNVNLYSEVIALADYLKDLDFRALGFEELEHVYNKDNIKDSWNDGSPGQTTPIAYLNPSTSGFRTNFETVKYPFVDWNHQFIVADNPGGGPGPTHGNTQLPTLETAFRPFINIKYLIDRIFKDSPFTYESDFFNTSDFKKLYMDFNWGADNFSNINTSYEATWDYSAGAAANVGNNSFKALRLIPEGVTGGAVGSTLPPNYDTNTYTITATTDNEMYAVYYNFSFENISLFDKVVDCRWRLTNALGNTSFNASSITIQNASVLGNGTANWVGSFLIILQENDTLKAQFDGDTSTRQNQSEVSEALFNVSNINVTSASLNTSRGELGQWDFLKGLLTMFNLVTLPDEDNPNNIKIEPYGNIFLPSTDINNPNFYDLNSVQLDWTDKIDVSQIKLTPLTDLNKKTMFKFVEDDDDYSFNQYKNLVGGHLYGSELSNAGDSFNILDGEEEIVAEPFAATIVKPLMSQFTQFITPAVYARGSEDEWEGFENSPRIMYNNGIKSTGSSYYIPAQNGLGSENQFNFLQFSHLSDVPVVTASRDFHFGICQLMPGVGGVVGGTVNNLFNIYWEPYFNELYNPDTRTMTIKVNLSPADINTFSFNFTVYIKNRLFRVNKIDYKPNDLATVEFILIP